MRATHFLKSSPYRIATSGDVTTSFEKTTRIRTSASFENANRVPHRCQSSAALSSAAAPHRQCETTPQQAKRRRRDLPSRKLTGRLTIRRGLQLYLSHMDAGSVSFMREERIPVSELKDVDVQIDEKDSIGKPTESGDGILTYPVTLGPNGADMFKLVYTIHAGSSVNLKTHRMARECVRATQYPRVYTGACRSRRRAL